MPSNHSVAENIVNEVEYLQRMARAGVPEHLREGLVRYLVHRIQPGRFLTAVLENNLTMAIARGDDISCAGLPALIRFLVNGAPGEASGSRRTVCAWLGHPEPELSVDFGPLEQSIDGAIATIDTLRAQRDELLEALRDSIRTIRQWHGMGMGPAEAQAWAIYQGSPEMTRINDAIARAEGRS